MQASELTTVVRRCMAGARMAESRLASTAARSWGSENSVPRAEASVAAACLADCSLALVPLFCSFSPDTSVASSCSSATLRLRSSSSEAASASTRPKRKLVAAGQGAAQGRLMVASQGTAQGTLMAASQGTAQGLTDRAEGAGRRPWWWWACIRVAHAAVSAVQTWCSLASSPACTQHSEQQLHTALRLHELATPLQHRACAVA